jgi:hypothetical protein
MAIQQESKIDVIDIKRGIERIFKILHERDSIPENSNFKHIIDSYFNEEYMDFQVKFLHYWENYSW